MSNENVCIPKDRYPIMKKKTLFRNFVAQVIKYSLKEIIIMKECCLLFMLRVSIIHRLIFVCSFIFKVGRSLRKICLKRYNSLLVGTKSQRNLKSFYVYCFKWENFVRRFSKKQCKIVNNCKTSSQKDYSVDFSRLNWNLFYWSLIS